MQLNQAKVTYLKQLLKLQRLGLQLEKSATLQRRYMVDTSQQKIQLEEHIARKLQPRLEIKERKSLKVLQIELKILLRMKAEIQEFQQRRWAKMDTIGVLRSSLVDLQIQDLMLMLEGYSKHLKKLQDKQLIMMSIQLVSVVQLLGIIPLCQL